MLGHIQTLLETQAANPRQCLAELPLLTARERYQILVEWNLALATLVRTLDIEARAFAVPTGCLSYTS